MNRFKKLTSLLLAGAMMFSLAACGQSSNDTTESAAASSQNNASAESTAQGSGSGSGSGAQDAVQNTESTASGNKTLVVYYSASGNTARVAQDIADAAGADLFEITPTEPYTSDDLDWRNQDSRVNREHEDESLRDVPLTTTTVENWDDYDTVFIGYPIWWAIAAWPVDNFVKNNDFTGKTVIPFATSTSSGMGQSGELLKDMAGTGDWQEGQRFQSNADKNEVTDWVNSLSIAE